MKENLAAIKENLATIKNYEKLKKKKNENKK